MPPAQLHPPHLIEICDETVYNYAKWDQYKTPKDPHNNKQLQYKCRFKHPSGTETHVQVKASYLRMGMNEDHYHAQIDQYVQARQAAKHRIVSAEAKKRRLTM